MKTEIQDKIIKTKQDVHLKNQPPIVFVLMISVMQLLSTFYR